MKKKAVANSPKAGARHLKNRVRDILTTMEIAPALDELYQLPARQVINPLFSFLYREDNHLKWAAVTAMGAIVARLADEDMEAARVIVRRLMWNLNDESGGIGWGSPEAMGEILACHKTLAKEYARILISYACEDGNFQEHELIQRGVLWGIGRLSQVRPDLVRHAVPYLIPYLKSRDAGIRGLAAWIMGLLGAEEARPCLEHLADDEARLQVYLERRLVEFSVKELAEEALPFTFHLRESDSYP